jgi:hypothetical protein
LSLWIIPQIREAPEEVFLGDTPELDLPFDVESDVELQGGVPGGQGGPLEIPGSPSPEGLGRPDGDPNQELFAPSAGAIFSPDAIALETAASSSEFGTGGLEAIANPLTPRGGGLDGRKVEGRLGQALRGGGTRRSEAAVEAGLVWLVEHQWSDGGWRFDLEACPNCAGYCRNSGINTSSTAATGLALLTFLGAGYTHQDGKYQEVVNKGIYYLVDHMSVTSLGGDLRDNRAFADDDKQRGALSALNALATRRDSMYSHGIATLALTEAYAMTRDPILRDSAEKAVKFIVNAQYGDGGWRYNPASESPGPGDMTVTGWQLAALKSALLAGIEIPYEVWTRASEFIDSLQYDGGASYSYVQGDRRPSAAPAIGLLCRMIAGWPREHRPLQKGAARIAAENPERNNIYFDFYASQVLRHVGGPLWEKWNPKMREYLIETQAVEGHERGSWYFNEAHSTHGGRLYTTAMAIMTLEVYYRYMPIYKEAFVGHAP